AAADLVEQFHQGGRLKFLAINGNRSSSFKAERDGFFAVGSLLGRACHLPGGVVGSVGSIFQLSAFMAQVPDIAVATMDLLAAGGHRDAALFGVVQAVFA